jgi:hypothetical protein
MITIFLRLLPIFCENIAAFFSKINVVIKFFQQLAVVWEKNANIFAKYFCENILEIITSVPVFVLTLEDPHRKKNSN